MENTYVRFEKIPQEIGVCIYTQQLIFFNCPVSVKEFYLSMSIKLFQKRFYSVVSFCFSSDKYSWRKNVRHIYAQRFSAAGFSGVRMYLPGHPAEFSRMYSFSNRIFQIAWLLWDNAIFPKKRFDSEV